MCLAAVLGRLPAVGKFGRVYDSLPLRDLEIKGDVTVWDPTKLWTRGQLPVEPPGNCNSLPKLIGQTKSELFVSH